MRGDIAARQEALVFNSITGYVVNLGYDTRVRAHLILSSKILLI